MIQQLLRFKTNKELQNYVHEKCGKYLFVGPSPQDYCYREVFFTQDHSVVYLVGCAPLTNLNKIIWTDYPRKYDRFKVDNIRGITEGEMCIMTCSKDNQFVDNGKSWEEIVLRPND